MGSPFFQPFDPTRPNDDVDYKYHHSRSKYDLNSRIMLTAIISLSAIVILVLALHIYARYFLRRQARRRGDALRRLGLSVSSARSAETGPTALPKRGLDPSLIASLPLLPFSPAADSSLECAVCLGALEAGELVRPLPACGHVFHAACIDTWLAGQSTCPVCRAEVDPTPRQPPVLRPEPREAPTAPSMGSLAASSSTCMEMETTSSSSDQQAESSSKALCNGNNGNGGSNRLSLSFRRILSRDRSSARIQPQLDQDVIEDLER